MREFQSADISETPLDASVVRRDEQQQRRTMSSENEDEQHQQDHDSAAAAAAAEALWSAHFNRLLSYKAQFGNCLVPLDYNDGDAIGIPLGKWVRNQRIAKKQDALRPSWVARLQSIGFVWTAKQSWESMFRRLVQYKDTHGDCHVPHDFDEDPKLASWVRAQRKKRKHILSQEQIERLNSIGFRWGAVQKNAWNTMYKRLETYQKKYGNCRIPFRYSADMKLGCWVHNQRNLRRNGRLSEECIERLDALGFIWRASTKATWDEMFGRLMQYRALNGDCDVPTRYEKDVRLGSWVSEQRCKNHTSLEDRRKRDGTISPEQVRRLDAVGFIWVARDASWDAMFHRLQTYKEQHAHCAVPWNYPPDPVLGNWVMRQRLFFRKLNTHQADELYSLDFFQERL